MQFSPSNLANAMGGEDKMKEMCIDPGSNFLSGKITTTFQRYVSSDTPIWIFHKFSVDGKETTKKYYEKDEAERALATANEEVKKAIEGVKGEKPESKNYIEEVKAGNIIKNLGQLDSNIAALMSLKNADPGIIAGIVTESMSIVMNNVKVKISDLSSFVVNLTLSVPGKVAKFTQEQFSKKIISFTDALKEEGLSLEFRAKEQTDAEPEEDNNDHLKKVKKIIGIVNGSVSLVTSELNDKLGMVAKYANEGPSWVCDQVNNLIADKMEAIDGEIRKGKNQLNKQFDDFCEGTGKKIGDQLAEEYNEIMRKAAKKVKDEINNGVEIAKIKAFSALQSAKLQIMAMTGLNIPLE